MQLNEFISSGLGLEAETLSTQQMCLRAVVVYAVALLMVRAVGNRRFAGQYAAIDIILSIVLGATLSRAINGSASFFPTLAAGLTLVISHWLLAALAYRFVSIERLVKGKPRALVQNGQANAEALRSAQITDQDLAMALRSQGSLTHPQQAQLALLEPSGSVSVLPKSSPPRVVDIAVEAGVKSVRIVLE